MSRKNRSHTKEFKLEALELLRTSGKSASQIERDLGITSGLLLKWRDRCQVKDTSPRRVGVDSENGEIVVLDEAYRGQGIFHGHVREWERLTSQMQNALRRAGLVDLRGNIIRR